MNRGYEHHRSTRHCIAREGRPRRLGGVQSSPNDAEDIVPFRRKGARHEWHCLKVEPRVRVCARQQCETLSRSNVTQVLHEAPVKGRARFFPPYVTLWTFLLQVLSPDDSCGDAGTRLRAFQVAQGEQPCSPNTGSYCKARGRLPEGVIARLAQAVGHQFSQDAPAHWRWKGRTVKLVDGSTNFCQFFAIFPRPEWH